MKDSILARLERELGPEQCDGAVNPPAIVPGDVSVLAEAMRIIAGEGGKARITAGGTMPVPETADDAVTVSLARLGGIREVSHGDFLVVAGAGTVADDVVAAARGERLFLPLDITSGDRATIGGAYMTSAVGPYAAGYGPFRDFVLGAKCVTASGEIVTFGGRTMKNVTGYEITRFLAGSRGLFAVAAELTLKTLPMPERRVVVVGRFGSAGDPSGVGLAVRDIPGVKACELTAPEGLGGTVTAGAAIEGMNAVTVRAERLVRECMERAGAESVAVETPDVFRDVRRRAAGNIVRAGMVTLQVPPPASAPLLQWFRHLFAGMPVLAHPMLGRMHLLPGEDNVPAVHGRVLALGGKHPFAWGDDVMGRFTPEERTVIQSLKRELDPGKVLNPQVWGKWGA